MIKYKIIEQSVWNFQGEEEWINITMLKNKEYDLVNVIEYSDIAGVHYFKLILKLKQ